MSNKLAPLRGMKDLLPDEYNIHKYIEKTALDTAHLYGYEGFSTPLLESASVFDRTLGDSSDVISKEMYSFQDRKGRLIALRPEFTASVMRAVISNGLKQKLPIKLFSCGALFRYDRPQEGRQRQFHQLNFENIGVQGPYSDAETIATAEHVLGNLAILSDVTLELNSLGCSDSRQRYQQALLEYFTKYFNELSVDSKQRLEKNPLRILDSKDEADKKIAASSPIISDFYTSNAATYFEQVQNYLDKLKIKYVLNPKLARGLDYYSHTTFEFTTSRLGAQSTILAGGRYDGLSSLMGESEIPAIGFAAGIERIALMKQYTIDKIRPVYILPVGQEGFDSSIELTNILRRSNISAMNSFEGKMSKRMQMAIMANARYAIFIGSEEVNNNNYKLKDLDSGIEQVVNMTNLMKILKS